MHSDTDVALFSDRARWQTWLDVEAALAAVQAELGIIPAAAAQTIGEMAHMDWLDEDELRREVAQTMAPVFALTKVLAKRCGPAGAYVHWGATTQNIIDAGLALTLRQVQARLSQRLGAALEGLADLADTHADTPMIGRTNRQHALPITFGFKVAGWADELIRVCDQLDDLEPRLFQLCFGGAIGACQSVGEQGPELSARLAARLGLHVARFPGRIQVDPQIEYISRLAMLGVCVSRMASESYGLMEQEIAELSEALDGAVVGSSTMPHKVNPKHVVDLQAHANLLRGKAAAGFAVTPPSHEGCAVTNRELRYLVEEASLLALTVSRNLLDVLQILRVDSARMQHNLGLTGDLTSMERLMMHLAPHLGRGAAHDLLHDAIHHAASDPVSLRRHLLAMPDIAAHLDAAALDALLDPLQNTGLSAQIARDVAQAARTRARALHETALAGAMAQD